MRRTGIIVAGCLVLFAAGASATTKPAGSVTPLHFIENRGQWPREVRYALKTSQAQYWFTEKECIIDVHRYYASRSTDSLRRTGTEYTIDSLCGHVIRMRFDNVSSLHEGAGTAQLPYVMNYFKGNDVSAWRSSVPSFKELVSSSTSRTAGMRYYIDESQLRYDINVEKGIDPRTVRVHIEGADRVSINRGGDLVMSTSLGEVVQKKLVAYQMIGLRRRVVPCAFNLNTDGTVGFTVGAYNRNQRLVIDPLLWASFIGGVSMATSFVNGPGTEDCLDVVADATGNAVVVGTTETNDFPTTLGAYRRVKTNAEPQFSTTDIFISKFAANGSSLIFSTLLGGGSSDLARSIRLDASDNIFVCGASMSTDYPTTANAYSRTKQGTGDGVITKLSANGASLLASTFIGGPGYDALVSLKLDGTSVFVCGTSFGPGYPITLGALQTNNPLDYATVVSVLNQNLQTLDASSYVGGIAVVNDMAIDAAGSMYLTGIAYDTLMLTTANAYNRFRNGVFGDMFLAVVNRAATTLIYGTYFGGEIEDVGTGVALDASGNVIICGKTMSPDFPTTVGAYDRTYNYLRGSARTGDPYDEVFDGFVVKFSSAYVLSWSTFIGGRSSDWFTHVVVGANGSAVMSGISYSPNFPATSCTVDSTQNGAADCVLTILNQSGNVVTYSTFLGGGDIEIAYSLCRMANGQIYLCGSTYDKAFPVTTGAVQTTRKLVDGFVAKIDPISGLTVNAGLDVLYSCTGFGTVVYLQAIPSCGVGPYSYLWSPATGLSDPRSDRPTTTTTPGGIEYTVTVTDASGAIAVNTVSLVPMLLKLTPGKDTVLCWGRNARLTTKVTGGMGPKTYSWFPARGLDNPSIANPLANPDTTTNYVLIVTDTAGCQKADTVTVRVSHATMKGSRDTNLCGAKQVKLDPRIEGAIAPLTYKWTTSGSAVLSTSPTPTFTVDSTTTYYFTVTDSLNCTGRDSITVHYSPVTTLTLKGDTLVCKGATATVKLTRSGGVAPFTYQWKSSDATTAFTKRDTVMSTIVNKNTTYTLTLKDSLGCTSTKDFIVRVDSASTPHIASEGNKRAICSGSALQLDAGRYPVTTYLWSTGEKTQKIKVTKEGWYTVTTKNALGCEGRDSIFIRVQSNPVAKLSDPRDTLICEGGTATLRVADIWKSYTWSNGATGPVNTVAAEGTYFVTVTDSLGCVGVSDSARVRIHTMSATLSGPNSVCSQTQASFTVESRPGWSYVWQIQKDGKIVGGQNTNTLQLSWSTEGTDSVIVIITDATSGCRIRRAQSVSITSTLKPTVTINGPSILCGSAKTTLSAPAGYDSYRWSSGETTPSITVGSAGTFAVFVTFSGCSGFSDSVTIRTAPPISVAIQGDSLLCEGASTQLHATPGYRNYLWSTADSTDAITVRQPGAYSVRVIDTNGCEAVANFTVGRHSVLLASNLSLNFSSLLIAKSVVLPLSIPNTSKESVTIQTAYLSTGTGSAFSIESVQSALPHQLVPGGTIIVNIRFSPTEVKLYSDTLVLTVSLPCADTIKIPLSGSGVDFTIKAKVEMTSVSAKAGDRPVRLPVYCSFEPAQDYSGVDCSLHVQYNSALFWLDDVSRGTIVNKTKVGTMEDVEIHMSNADVKSGAIICELHGMALISSEPSTPLTPRISWNSGVAAQTLHVPGVLYVGGCAIDYKDIQLIGQFELMVRPNPSEQDVHMVMTSSELGLHTITLFDAQGNVVAEQRLIQKDKNVNTEIQFNDIASGSYRAVMSSNGRSTIQGFIVVR